MRSARVLPIRAASFDSGVSISYCNRAVEARVEPRTAPRRSSMTTDEAGIAQLLGSHGAADAGADDQRVTTHIPGQAPCRKAQQRAPLPDRMAGSQISLAGGAHILGSQQNKGRPKAPFALQ